MTTAPVTTADVLAELVAERAPKIAADREVRRIKRHDQAFADNERNDPALMAAIKARDEEMAAAVAKRAATFALLKADGEAITEVRVRHASIVSPLAAAREVNESIMSSTVSPRLGEFKQWLTSRADAMRRDFRMYDDLGERLAAIASAREECDKLRLLPEKEFERRLTALRESVEGKIS
jgi:hypothetical protein